MESIRTEKTADWERSSDIKSENIYGVPDDKDLLHGETMSPTAINYSTETYLGTPRPPERLLGHVVLVATVLDTRPHRTEQVLVADTHRDRDRADVAQGRGVRGPSVRRRAGHSGHLIRVEAWHLQVIHLAVPRRLEPGRRLQAGRGGRVEADLDSPQLGGQSSHSGGDS